MFLNTEVIIVQIKISTEQMRIIRIRPKWSEKNPLAKHPIAAPISSAEDINPLMNAV